jgi:CspA family cold shock protein
MASQVQAVLGRTTPSEPFPKDVNTLQGVVKSYDPVTRDGLVVTDTADMVEYELAPNALDGSVFRMLRPGQRVIFDLDGQSRASALRLGSEVDMATPTWLESE